MRFIRWRPRTVLSPVVGHLNGVAQSMYIHGEALVHVTRHQQRGAWATEAGGQLFGSVSEEAVRIVAATGPYMGDERSRYRYRSNPQSAQAAISRSAKVGLLYLGEWHTHAEDEPELSGSDEDAITTLRARSKLNASAVVLLIVGRAEPPRGLAVYSCDGQTPVKWTLSCGEA
jgi:integrative and conjugative element protein (TIGR02256 family)